MLRILIITTLLLFGNSSKKITDGPCNDGLPRGGDQEWGTGVYYIPIDSLIPIYDEKSLELAGHLWRDDGGIHLSDSERDYEYMYVQTREYIGHSSLHLLQVKNSLDDFMTFNWKNEEYFPKTKYPTLKVKKTEMTQKGSLFYTYKELLTSSHVPKEIQKWRDFAHVGINITKGCLNLRELPSSKSLKILCVPGNDWGYEQQTALSIIETSGEWAKLKIQLKDYVGVNESLECDIYEVREEYVGWSKFVDESGFPNIWFSVTSY